MDTYHAAPWSSPSNSRYNKLLLVFGFEPVQNVILLVGTAERNKKNNGSVQNKTIGHFLGFQTLRLTTVNFKERDETP
jgi:hypothetical protein